MGVQVTSPKRRHSPQFSADLYCDQTAGCIKMVTWYGGRPEPRRLCVGWGTSPHAKRDGAPPNFRPTYIVAKRLHGSMDQDATWHGGIGLGLREIVFDVETAPPPRKLAHPSPPNFGPMSILTQRLLWPNGCMDEDASWYGNRPRPRPHSTRRGPSSRERGTAAPPSFRSHVYCGDGHPSHLLLRCF